MPTRLEKQFDAVMHGIYVEAGKLGYYAYAKSEKASSPVPKWA